VWVLGTLAKRWTAACSLRGSIPLFSAVVVQPKWDLVTCDPYG
jgi:hypothetical protein